MNNCKSRCANSIPPNINNSIMTCPSHVPIIQRRIAVDERCDGSPELWGQFVDIETMYLVPQREHKTNNNWRPSRNTIIEDKNETSELWYKDNPRSSICSNVEVLGKFVLSLLYGFAFIKNSDTSDTSDTSTSIAESRPP